MASHLYEVSSGYDKAGFRDSTPRALVTTYATRKFVCAAYFW